MLPDLHLTSATDAGVFFPAGSIPAPGCCWTPRRRRPPAATCWTSAADTDRCSRPRRPRARGQGLGRRREPARPRPVRGERELGTGLGNVRCLMPPAATTTALPPDVRLIWSNPPIRIGKQALHELLVDLVVRLAAGAAAYLVVQRQPGSDSLQRWLAAAGWDASRFAARGRVPGAWGAAGEPAPARPDRGQAAQPGLAAADPQAGSACSWTASGSRSTSARSSRQRRRVRRQPDLALRGHRAARSPVRAQDLARHRPPALVRAGATAPLGAQAARAAGFRVVAVELAGDAVPLHEARCPVTSAWPSATRITAARPGCWRPPTWSPTFRRSAKSARSMSRRPRRSPWRRFAGGNGRASRGNRAASFPTRLPSV